MVLALALTMTLVGTALAAQAPANARSLDGTLTVNGLAEGDIVTLYKVIEWGSNDYWVASDGFAKTDTLTGGLDQAEVDTIVGQDHVTGAKSTANLADSVDKIIGLALNATPVSSHNADTVGSTGVYTVTGLPAGLYYVSVAPKNATTLYHTMMASIDYDQPDAGDTCTINAKKETITLEKTATAQTNNNDSTAAYTSPANTYNTVGIGDTVDFQIETMMPNFPANFTNPVFKISDSLTGLTLKHAAGEIKVYTEAVAQANLVTLGATTYAETTANDSSFVLTFAKDFISAYGGKKILVVYQGIVDNTATYEANVKDNTAKVNFSNNPTDNVGANELEDKTKHYTFSIDAIVNGSRHGTDVIKIGVDKDGNEITTTVQLPNANWAGVLEGAKFSLYTDETCTTPYKTGYTNLVSDAQGLINIAGLDAGTYWLKETDAPEGYIKAQNPVKIEIKPVFKETTVAAQTKDVTVGSETITVTVPAYTYAELASFTIEINGEQTSSYTWTNEAIGTFDDSTIANGSTQNNPSTDKIGKIQNTKGVELPSTGGIGTTIFYVAGIVLVLGAAAIIVARRKAEQE